MIFNMALKEPAVKILLTESIVLPSFLHDAKLNFSRKILNS
jgi:hypothetical protein